MAEPSLCSTDLGKVNPHEGELSGATKGIMLNTLVENPLFQVGSCCLMPMVHLSMKWRTKELDARFKCV